MLPGRWYPGDAGGVRTSPPAPRYGVRMGDPYWNHNVHYHPVVLGAVPDGCGAALDVGCGDGLLVRKLAARARTVTGVDRSPEMIRQARELGAAVANASFVADDFLSGGHLAPGSYDFVCSVTTVHHMDFEAAVTRMADLLAPGGRLVIVGLARNRTPPDWIAAAAGFPAHRLHARRHGGTSGPAAMPVLDPEMSWGQVRRAAHRLLPGCRYRRHLLWRYSVRWEKPGG